MLVYVWVGSCGGRCARAPDTPPRRCYIMHRTATHLLKPHPNTDTINTGGEGGQPREAPLGHGAGLVPLLLVLAAPGAAQADARRVRCVTCVYMCVRKNESTRHPHTYQPRNPNTHHHNNKHTLAGGQPGPVSIMELSKRTSFLCEVRVLYVVGEGCVCVCVTADPHQSIIQSIPNPAYTLSTE